MDNKEEKEVVIPLSEYRRAGFKLFFNNTSLSGVVVSSGFAGLLLPFIFGVIVAFAVFLEFVFSGGATSASGATSWFALSLGSTTNLFSIALIPFMVLYQLRLVVLLFVTVFAIAGVLFRFSFKRTTDFNLGKSGSLFYRYTHVELFALTSFIVLLSVMQKYITNPHLTHIGNTGVEHSTVYLTILAVSIGAIVTAMAVNYLYQWGIFKTLGLYHFLFVKDDKRVNSKRIKKIFLKDD